MAERGHSLESIKASIEARKPDFDAFIGMFFLKVQTNILLFTSSRVFNPMNSLGWKTFLSIFLEIFY